MRAMLSDDAAQAPALLSSDTLDALQLHSQPFLPPDGPEALHVDAANDARLAELAAALHDGDELLLLLGPDGAGKSCLLTLLEADTQTSGVQCFPVAGSERFDTHNLVAGMLEAFKVEPPDELQDALDALGPCLEDMRGRQLSCAVVIDDAERIPVAELTRLLSALLYLNGGKPSLLRLLLAAPDDFEEQVPDMIPQGADLPYAALPLEPLDTGRSAELLGFRLAQAGLQSELPFDEGDLATLEARTGGWPGPLLAAAADLLNERHGPLRSGLGAALPFASGNRPRLSLVGERLPKLLLGGLALLLIAAGLLLFLPTPPQSSSERYTVTETRKVEPLGGSGENADALKSTGTVADGAPETAAETDASTVAGNAAETGDPSDAASNPTANNEALGNDASASDATTVAEARRAAEGGKTAMPASEQGASADAGDTTEAAAPGTDDNKAPAAELDSEPASAADSTTAEADASDPAPEIIADDATPAASTTASASTATPSGGTAADASGRTALTARTLESPNWVLVQNPEQYTIQMIAAVDRESIEEFLEEHALEPPNSVFSFERRGATWHAMVHGLYPSIEAAQTAIDRLPEATRVNQPWIRSISRLQGTLRDQDLQQ